MNGLAARGAVKFGICALIAAFVSVAVIAGWPLGFFKAALYTCGGGVCIRLAWPTQAEGDALLNDGEAPAE